MHIRSTVHPGQRGTKKLLTQFGDRLVCVRYRYDDQRQKRIKTVELIVEEKIGWLPPSRLKKKMSSILHSPCKSFLFGNRSNNVGGDGIPNGDCGQYGMSTFWRLDYKHESLT